MMRPAALLGGLVAVLSTAAPALGQTENVDMVVSVPEVEARSGGTTSYYATSKLRYGQVVHVIQESKKYPGWLAIKPPAGSFSWINARFVEETGPYLGKVVTDPDSQVPVYPGSLLSNQTPDVEIAKLARGTLVTILPGPANYTSTGKWVPIAPTPQESRYIPANAVKRADAAQIAAAQPTHRVGTSPGATYQANGTPYPPGHPHHMTSTSTPGNGWTPSTPSITISQPAAPFQATYNNPTLDPRASQSQTNSSSATTSVRWSEYGILRKTSCQREGQPCCVLLGRRGEVLLYVTSPNPGSLEPYVNRVVSLYGRITYPADPLWRNYFMHATHVTVP